MKRKMFLTVAAVAAVAVGAKAQGVIQAPAGQAFTIISNVPASAVTEVAYQWYRDNNPISGATKESYTVPAAQAYGDNVQFYRMATAQECAGVAEKKSNIITITFTGFIIPEGCGLIINGLCWADCNIDDLQTFAARADMFTKFYQWNRLTAYSANEPLTPAWNATADTSATWKVNPCPTNWRIPSRAEYQQLINIGSTWAEANTRGNLVVGRFYGYNHATCTLPNNMSGCLFFALDGGRNPPAGAIDRTTVGCYWTATYYNDISAYFFRFTNTSSSIVTNDKVVSYPIRCVR